MDPRTKNKIGALGFGLLLLAVVVYATVTWWPEAWTTSPKGTSVKKALAADLSGYDDVKLTEFIRDLHFKGSTHEQRLALAQKLKDYFDRMPVLQRLALMLRMRRIFEEEPHSELVTNARTIMQDFWNQQIKDYMSAPPEQRKKLLDDRIDEQVAMENLEKLQKAAKSLLGMKPGQAGGPAEDPLYRDIGKFRTVLADAIADSFTTTPPAERAGASQLFLDLRRRRQERGLPVPF